MSAPAWRRLQSGSSCSSSCPSLLMVSLDGDATDHAVVTVTGDQAGIFERSGLGEFPEDLGALVRLEPHPVRIVVLHLRMFLHQLGMLQILCGGGEQELVILDTDIAEHEADLFAARDLDTGRRKIHLVE